MSDAPMIPVAKPWLGEEEAAAARRAILSGWVTQGPEVAALEREFAEYVGASHAAAVANCTVALHLALRAVGVEPETEVITVSHSYIATANSVRYCGAVPVFVDIDPVYFNIDVTKIEAAISPKTRAILCVHQIGMPCFMRAIADVSRKHGIPVVEDAACAIGSEILHQGNWERIGRPHSDVACFSFHPRKLVSTGDGGMLTTNNAEYDRKFRLWRQHSMSVPDTKRHASSQVIFEDYPELGYNYRLTDIQAAVGREQLKRLPAMIERRRTMAERYRKLFSEIPGIVAPSEPEWARTNWQSYCVKLPEGCDQKAVMQAMLDAGVSTRRAVMCVHREPAYRKEPWRCGCGERDCGGKCLRVSETIQDTAIILPLFHQMAEAEQDRVVAAMRNSLHVATATSSATRRV